MAVHHLPFDWDDPYQVGIINNARKPNRIDRWGVTCETTSFYENITGIFNGYTYKLEISPAGNEPAQWHSGILANRDNYYVRKKPIEDYDSISGTARWYFSVKKGELFLNFENMPRPSTMSGIIELISGDSWGIKFDSDEFLPLSNWREDTTSGELLADS